MAVTMARGAELLLLLLLPPGTGGQDVLSPEDTASCIFDVLNVAYQISEAGLYIDSSVETCDLHRPDQIACTTDVTGIIGAFTSIGSLIAAIVVDCPVQKDQNAACAADIVGFISTIAALAQASASFVTTCHDWDVKHRAGQHPSKAGAPRVLEAVNRSFALTPERIAIMEQQAALDPVDIAWCVIDVLEVATELGTVGLAINDAVSTCKTDAQGCAGTALDIVAQLTDVASTLSAAAHDCAVGVHQQALCSADVFQVVSSLVAVAQFGVAVKADCSGTQGRRLAHSPAANTSTPHEELRRLRANTERFKRELRGAWGRQQAALAARERKLSAVPGEEQRLLV